MRERRVLICGGTGRGGTNRTGDATQSEETDTVEGKIHGAQNTARLRYEGP